MRSEKKREGEIEWYSTSLMKADVWLLRLDIFKWLCHSHPDIFRFIRDKNLLFAFFLCFIQHSFESRLATLFFNFRIIVYWISHLIIWFFHPKENSNKWWIIRDQQNSTDTWMTWLLLMNRANQNIYLYSNLAKLL